MIRFFGIFTLFLLSVSAYGQEVGAPAPDSVYTALLRQEQALRARTDSLLGIIDRERQQLAADTTDLRTRSQAILRREEAVFALRNELGAVASKINRIEQERILNDLLRPASAAVVPSGPATNEPNLIDNAWFRDSLSPEEYRQLQAGKDTRPQIDRLIADYRSEYRALQGIAESYHRTASQPAADSLYGLYRSGTARIRQSEREFRAVWGERYEEEVYLYSYLLDKLNRTADLSALNEQNRNRPVFDADRVMSTVFAAYPGQRALLTGYELALAGALNLTAAADSLRRAEQATAGVEMDFPKIELAEKEFFTWQDITFPDTSLYNADNPIPELQIPGAGTFYSVTVGTFPQRQAASVFHGAVPLAVQRVGTQWRYFAGLFRSYGDAAEAVQQLSDAGFRRPEAVRWRDGAYTNLAAEAAENEGFFRVEIQTDGELSDEIREVLTRYARTKEITRTGDLFHVGTFTDRLQADEVVEALGRIGVEAEII